MPKHLVMGADRTTVLTNKEAIVCVERVRDYSLRVWFKTVGHIDIKYTSKEQMTQELAWVIKWMNEE